MTVEKVIYLVRHCQASGQSPEAALTAEGERQASELAGFFENKGIIHIVSSPYVRTVQSIEQTAKLLALPIEKDVRLRERILSPENLPNWLEHLERSFTDLDMKLPLGESGLEAMARGLEVLRNVPSQSILMTHGNLMALLLMHFDDTFGFKGWTELNNPDVYEVRLEGGKQVIKRLKIKPESIPAEEG